MEEKKKFDIKNMTKKQKIWTIVVASVIVVALALGLGLGLGLKGNFLGKWEATKNFKPNYDQTTNKPDYDNMQEIAIPDGMSMVLEITKDKMTIKMTGEDDSTISYKKTNKTMKSKDGKMTFTIFVTLNEDGSEDN
jgi:hypothetical protein